MRACKASPSNASPGTAAGEVEGAPKAGVAGTEGATSTASAGVGAGLIAGDNPAPESEGSDNDGTDGADDNDDAAELCGLERSNTENDPAAGGGVGAGTDGASADETDGSGSPGSAAKKAFAIFVKRSGSGSPGGGKPPPDGRLAAAASASRSAGPCGSPRSAIDMILAHLDAFENAERIVGQHRERAVERDEI